MITEEQRQALIARANYLKQVCSPDGEDYVLAEIALASLKAEPEVFLDSMGDTLSDNQAKKRKDAGLEVIELYTALPVTVLKLPYEFTGINGGLYSSGRQHGWNDCLKEFKRLNGLK